MSFDTGPCTPRKFPRSASCITRRTALEKPSNSRSISRSIFIRAPTLQLFAYYMAVLRGCDVDKPRNLAKSVTVE